jgi:Fic-DOC domain mobile mystery protein B
MSDALLPIGDGHTDLSEEDRLGLLPTYIATRGELFDAEQRNIVEALLRPSPTTARMLDDRYLRELHRAMFGAVWGWAGSYRRRETNIGIDPLRISTEVRTLVDDAKAWVEHGSYERDELCVRFHHRLVYIHPFVNGNGRHGRVAADHLVASLGGDRFTWGAGSRVGTAELRTAYRRALVVADQGDLTELVRFARA